MEFERDAAEQILETDGLVVFAKGLGVHSLLRRFITLYTTFPTVVLLICNKRKLGMIQESVSYEGMRKGRIDILI